MSFIFVTWHNDTAAPDFRSLDPMTACNGTLVVVGIPPLAPIINISEVRVFLIPLEAHRYQRGRGAALGKNNSTFPHIFCKVKISSLFQKFYRIILSLNVEFQ